MDLSLIFQQKKSDQDLLNSAALMAARYLPYKESPEAAARKYLEQMGLPIDEESLKIKRTNSEIHLLLQRPIQSALVKLIGGTHAGPLINSVSAKAVVVPRNIWLFMDTSSYFGLPVHGGLELFFSRITSATVPSPIQLYERSLDLPNEFWQRAPLLTMTNAYIGLSEGSGYRYTARCFNPNINGMKQGVLRFYDYLSSFPLNSVGVVAGPVQQHIGGAASLHQIRPVIKGGFTWTDGREAEINTHHHDTGIDPSHGIRLTYTSNPVCLAMAEHSQENPDPGNRTRYRVPAFTNDIDVTELFGTPAPPEERLTNWNTGELRPVFINRMTTRKAIWSYSIVPEPRIVNFRMVLNRLRQDLIEEPNLERPDRGFLEQLTTSTAYIFLGEVPSIQNGTFRFQVGTDEFDPIGESIRDGLIEINQALVARGRELNLNLMIMRHTGILDYTSQTTNSLYQSGCTTYPCRPFNRRLSALDVFINKMISDYNLDNIKFALVSVTDPGSLVHEVSAYLPLVGQTALLVND